MSISTNLPWNSPCTFSAGRFGKQMMRNDSKWKCTTCYPIRPLSSKPNICFCVFFFISSFCNRLVILRPPRLQPDEKGRIAWLIKQRSPKEALPLRLHLRWKTTWTLGTRFCYLSFFIHWYTLLMWNRSWIQDCWHKSSLSTPRAGKLPKLCALTVEKVLVHTYTLYVLHWQNNFVTLKNRIQSSNLVCK